MDIDRYLEEQQDVLMTELHGGFISLEEYNRRVHELEADAREAAREAAWDSFSAELDR